MAGPFDRLDQKAFADLVSRAATSNAIPDAHVVTYRDLLEEAKRMPPPVDLGVLHLAPALLERGGGELAAKVPSHAAPFAGFPVVVNSALPPGEWRLVPRTSLPVVSRVGPPAPLDDGTGFRITLRTDIPPFTATLSELGLDEPRPTRWRRFKAWVRRLLGRA
jgi:hypothetical protein